MTISLANMVEGGRRPCLSAEVLREIGCKIAIVPVSALPGVACRLEEICATLPKGEGLSAPAPRVAFRRYNEIVGLPELLASAAKLADKEN